MKSIELFSGAGGLALGLAKAGIKHEYLVERDRDACATLLKNKVSGPRLAHHWNVFDGDVRQFDYKPFEGKIDMVAGGPPCQPFSLGGKHRGKDDHRDMFPEAVRSVASLKPKVFVFENVKGLLRQNFSSYFAYIILQLKYPELSKHPQETWQDHHSRLERYHTKGRHDGLYYRVLFRLVNAANHGVPQIRHRVFIIGFRHDLKQEWSFPAATHSLDALLYSQHVSGEYWDIHKVPRNERPAVHPALALRVEKLRVENNLFPISRKRWLTVRDAINGLPDPRLGSNGSVFHNHEYRSGAKSYPGHTGSNLDEPAKTLKAGDHGVPGGENMLRFHNGKPRYFTARESARIQTFPDDYIFSGSWTEAMRQIGNAVPVRLAETVGAAIMRHLSEN